MAWTSSRIRFSAGSSLITLSRKDSSNTSCGPRCPGADVASVSRQLGHANVSITLSIYTHAFEKRAESGIGSKMDQLIQAETPDPGLGVISA